MARICCNRCELNKQASRLDPEFCHECVEDIECAKNNVMTRTRAAVRYLNNTNSDKAAHMQAFLSIFHPHLSHRKIWEMTRDV